MASNDERSPAEKSVPNLNETYQVISENSDTCARCNESFTKCTCLTIKNVMNGDGNDHSKLIVNKHGTLEFYTKENLIRF